MDEVVNALNDQLESLGSGFRLEEGFHQLPQSAQQQQLAKAQAIINDYLLRGQALIFRHLGIKADPGTAELLTAMANAR